MTPNFDSLLYNILAFSTSLPPPQFFYTQGRRPARPRSAAGGSLAILVLGNHVPDGTGHERLTGPFPKLEQPPTPRRINVAHIRKFGVAVPD